MAWLACGGLIEAAAAVRWKALGVMHGRAGAGEAAARDETSGSAIEEAVQWKGKNTAGGAAGRGK